MGFLGANMDTDSWTYAEKLEQKVRELLDGYNFGHSYAHAERVWDLSQKIIDGEDIFVDYEVVYAASLLHDVGYIVNNPKDPKKFRHPDESVKIAKKILPELGFPKKKMPKTLEAILLHDDIKPWGRMRHSTYAEVWIVQDADCIETFGFKGIQRIMDYGKRVGMKLYDKNLRWDDPDAKDRSILHNIQAHIDIYERLNTVTARKIAKPLINQMTHYIEKQLPKLSSLQL